MEVFRYQAGYDDIEKKTPVNPKALYYLLSCSKPITCTAAMQLYEKGYFVMEEPVSKYLPEFKEMCLLRFKPNGEADVVKAHIDRHVLRRISTGEYFQAMRHETYRFSCNSGNQGADACEISAQCTDGCL